MRAPDLIAERAAALAAQRPWIFVNELSRLVVDPKRFLDEREEMNQVGMGPVYTRTSDGFVLRDPSDDEISGLVDQYLTPYAAALSASSTPGSPPSARSRSSTCTPIPVPLLYELHADAQRPQICIGIGPFHTSDKLTAAATSAFDV